MTHVKTNLNSVKQRITRAAEKAGRDAGDIKLVVVTKEATDEQIREAIDLGVRDVGENRVKDALFKQKLFDDPGITWHMIGHLQSKKVKDAVSLFSLIHSVDSLKLVCAIDREAERLGKRQDILIEVNTSGEEAKFGIKPEEAGNFIKETSPLKNVRLAGLMTMAPFVSPVRKSSISNGVNDAEEVRLYFRKLKELADKFALKELSMGMTQDFEVAIEEGATIVRVGTAIFGS